MALEFQYLFNLGIMALAGVATYLFNKIQDHEKRIQKVEDVTSIKIDSLIDKVDKLEISNEKLNVNFTELVHNIHKEKKVENELTQTLSLLLKKLTQDETHK
jgi:hypothetical protein